MKKIRLGIYIEDSEYGDRLTCYFMNDYKDQLEIHMYTMKEQLEHLEGEIDIMLSSELDQWNNKYIPLIQIVEETPIESEEGIYFVEKYQEVNRIVEEILKHVGGEVRDLKSEGSLIGHTRLISVYSLADNQYQMPFAMTLSSILSENEKVLLMDFQENSGLSRMLEQSVEHNLDELLVMAESGRYSTNRINSCIGRKHKLDYVYPIENTECLCEINTVICNNLLQMLGKEMHYDCIVLNMGTRFKGFFDILDRCSDIYLVQKKGGISQWREYEFTEELIERGLSNVVERIKLIEPPVITTPVSTCMLSEIQEMNRQIKMNQTFEAVLSEFAHRSGLEDIVNFSDIFSFAKRSGGRFVDIIESTTYRMWTKYDTNRQIEVAVSAKRLEQKTMNYIPIFLLAFLKLSSRDYMSALYGNLIGVIFMSTCLLAYAGAIKLAKKFLQVGIGI